MNIVLASLEDDATGLVTIQTDSSRVQPSIFSTSYTAPILTTPAPSTATSAPAEATGAAPRMAGLVGREVLFGAAGAFGAGIFGL